MDGGLFIHNLLCNLTFFAFIYNAKFHFNDKLNYPNYSHINIFNAVVFMVNIRPGFVFFFTMCTCCGGVGDIPTNEPPQNVAT